jgi:chromosome segregation ATPase
MTSTRYFIARIAQAFGYYQKSQRMGDAASEMHLLREAETMLGLAIWEKVENIEALSVEYWNLRKLIKERDEIREKLAARQARLDQAHEERANIINMIPEGNQDLLDERTKLLSELETLSMRRDQIVAEAQEVRRSHVGLKMKLEVLTDQAHDSTAAKAEIDKVKSQLGELKSRFAELKQIRIEISRETDSGDLKIDQLEEKLNENRGGRKVLASEAFQVIGEGNKEISTLRAECGVIDTRMHQLYAEIGRYVSRNMRTNRACATACSSHRGLVDVMHALRHSIALNHRLAGLA